MNASCLTSRSSAALMDTSQLSLATRINITGSLGSKRVSVPGARHISAVVVIAIETVTATFSIGWKRTARAQIFENPQADVSLSPAQKKLIVHFRLNFNRIKYEPEWEA